jgi:putative ABC transport system substrate-binding protein
MLDQGRRRFIALIAGVASAVAAPCAGWPFAVRAQQPALPVIGFLSSLTESDRTRILTPFHHGLAEAGYVEGRNVAVDSPASWLEGTNAQAAAQAIGVQAHVLSASSADQIDEAFTTMARDRISTLIASADPMFFNNRAQLIALCARHGVPASYADHEYPEAGGLFSYGASRSDAYRQAGLYIGRILKGEKPGALPVVLPTKFDLIINLKTAKTLGITVPLTLQASADEVIE